MKKHLLVLTSLAFLAVPLSANAQSKLKTLPYDKLPAGEYSLDLAHASLIWKVSHFGLSNYTARFTKFDATLNYDPKDLTKSKVTVSVDPTSLKTDYPNAKEKDFDKKLVEGEDWFNTKKFPQIKFESTKIEKVSDTDGKIHGSLTFLGVSKPVVLNAKFNGGYTEYPFAKGPIMGFSAEATLKRSEWGFSQYVPNVGDEVKIQIEAEFHKKE